MDENRYVEVVRYPLFEQDDFASRGGLKSFREQCETEPMIHFDLDASESSLPAVNVKLCFVKRNTKRLAKVEFEPYEPLLRSFWLSQYGDADLLPDFHPGFQPWRKRAKPSARIFPRAIDRWPPVRFFVRIWDHYRTHSEVGTIRKNQFAKWLCRLHWVGHDFVEILTCSDESWQQYSKEISRIVKDPHCGNFEYYVKSRWMEVLEQPSISIADAFHNRLCDAKQLLNKFFSSVNTDDDPLKTYLFLCYESFGSWLCRDKLLIRCQECGRFIDFRGGKKFCSLLTEGRDCGKRFRNRQYYRQHKKETK